MNRVAHISRITGTLVEARPLLGAGLYELARVGAGGLLAEVIRVEGEMATLQVYEETTGLQIGEPVTLSGHALTVQLGPGLLGAVVDGLGRPLAHLARAAGSFIQPGMDAPTLDSAALWEFRPAVQRGDRVAEGDMLGDLEERPGFMHRVLVPPGMAGTVRTIHAGPCSIADVIAALDEGGEIGLAQHWPVRRPRPVAQRLADDRPFVTGQRVFDFLFPAAEGGSVAVPGGFGTGKTVIEQSLARYGAADVMVYIGCGERGNEMAEVLNEFPRLTDPRTGRSIMDRTVMVVNTSNMPVAAREASVYLGVTIAEYYRDMGYRVAVMADSLSRWAEALREISARLQEMPGEEGYPTYLANRMGQFFERAARVRTLGSPPREGALTLISAISPPGGDFSEPVTQAALRVVGAVWALDPDMAHQRQFPAVDWETSYSLYAEGVAPWLEREGGPGWSGLRTDLLALLQRGRELREIAALVGAEALQDQDRVTLETVRAIREAVLGQSAFDPNDASSPLRKTWLLAHLALRFHSAALRALEAGATFAALDLNPSRHALYAVRDAGPEDLERAAQQAETVLDRLAPAESGV